MQTLQTCTDQEIQRFLDTHQRSMALSQHSSQHFIHGAPLHWMSDWSLPHLIHIQDGNGHTLRDVDGNEYIDLCLGDSGAMFGHRPAALDSVLQDSTMPLTCMLPSHLLAEVGDALQTRFGLPFWQVTLSASDANRFLIRWARAITKRKHVLVFDGCYHGAVDDLLVDATQGGVAKPRSSLLGETYSHAQHTRVVPFNDLEALSQALVDQDVACLIAEPALTNCGLILPDADFWPEVRKLCQSAGTLLVLDETHTLSSGLGGYAIQNSIQVDAVVMGKAIAGGWPCGVYGFSHQMAQDMVLAKANAPLGHSGIGTTLSGNAISIAALHASLSKLHQRETFNLMLLAAEQLCSGLEALLAKHQRPWNITRLGARLELQFCSQAPRNAVDARAAQDDRCERFIHLFMLNRGVLLTPFHNMMLCAPSLDTNSLSHILRHFDDCLATLKDVY